jgi:AcrR family transcriptional regulator
VIKDGCEAVSTDTPGRNASTTNKSAKTRIFEAATELFAHNGYHATGVQELSEAVGLGRGALYYHIKSKEDLLFNISMSLLEDMLVKARLVADSDETPEEKIRQLGRELVENLAEHRAGWRVSLYESRSLSEDLHRHVVAARDAYEAIWADVLAKGTAENTLRPVSSMVLRGALGLLNSTHLWMGARGPVAPTDIADVFMDLLLDGLRQPKNRS